MEAAAARTHDVDHEYAPMTKPNQSTAIHGGQQPETCTRPVTTPIYTSATYRFESTADLRAYMAGEREAFHYSRYGNPTVRAAEYAVAALENAQDAVLVSSGMAALTTALTTLLRGGQHAVFTSDIYRPTAELLAGLLERFGIESTRVDTDDLDALEAAIRPGVTKVIFTELPTNPHNRVVDIERLAAIKKKARARLVVDATFATPYNARPLELGADVVVHSLSKYIGGHNDLIAGAIVCRAAVADAFREQRAMLGGILDPNSAYNLIRGIKTFPMRMERHNANALAVARALEAHPKVEAVFYPMLESHADYELAKRTLHGGGGVVTFRFRGDLDQTSGVIDRLKLISHSASLGGVESLAHQPAVFSHSDLTPEARLDVGVTDNLIRVAIGLEEPEDIIQDLYQALDADA